MNNSSVNSNNSQNLFEWINQNPSLEDKQKVFLNMDIALKYIHEHGYCIECFYPTDIMILNNNPEYVQFTKLLELSNDSIKNKQIIQEDLFNSSVIQIGIYTNTLKYMNIDFLKENFDSFTQFLPPDDVSYYRGIVQRGASVYYSDFVAEKNKRALEALSSELGETDGGKSLIKSSNNRIDLNNNSINDNIYYQLNGSREDAYINLLLIPFIIIMSIFLISVLGPFFK